MVGSRQCCDSHRLTSRHDGGRRSAILARDRIVENLKGHGPTPRRIPLGVASRPYSLNWGPTNKGARLLTSALCARCDEAHNAGRRFAKLDWGGAKFSFVACASDRSRHGMRYASKARRVVLSMLASSAIREVADTNAIRVAPERCADESLEGGDVKAIAPFLKVVRELNLYHGLKVVVAHPTPAALPEIGPTSAPLALTHAPGVVVAEASAEGEKVAQKRS
jgi:hypothetical protein